MRGSTHTMLGLTSGDTAAMNVGTANAHVTTSRGTEATRIVVGVVLVGQAGRQAVVIELAIGAQPAEKRPTRSAQF